MLQFHPFVRFEVHEIRDLLYVSRILAIGFHQNQLYIKLVVKYCLVLVENTQKMSILKPREGVTDVTIDGNMQHL